MKKILFPLLLSLTSLPALAVDPFRIVIFADSGATARAQQLERHIRANVPPFNRIPAGQLQIEVRTLVGEDNKMNCQRHAVITRLMTCDDNFITREAGNALPIALKSIPETDEAMGSGGSVAVASTNLPLNDVVHEMLHVAGMDDEYGYTAGAEQQAYCANPTPTTNFAYFAPQPPYASDGAARTRHASQVLWMSRILASTAVIQSATQLGSGSPAPVDGQQRIGLYPGDKCPPDPATGRVAWRPYVDSIMRRQQISDGTIYPVYEQAFIDYIQARIDRPLSLNRRTASDSSRLAGLEVEVNDPAVQIIESAGGTPVSAE